MKIKTSTLIGTALNWAVAKCKGITVHKFKESSSMFVGSGFDKYSPTTDWAQGGPIIEREKISLDADDSPTWLGMTFDGKVYEIGPTPLVAAMRCYVASKLGAEVDIPDDLANQ